MGNGNGRMDQGRPRSGHAVPSHTLWQAPAVDAVFSILASRRRRTLVRVLAKKNETISTDLLVTEVARRTDASPDGSETNLEHALHHVDLPKLEDVGLITRDGDGNITPTSFCVAVETALVAFSAELLPENPE